jgi:hypothetical protein
MKWIGLLFLVLLTACNSKEPGLSSLAGLSNSTSTTSPYITSVTVPPNGLYAIGQTLNFFFKFSKVVEVQGTPRLTFAGENAVRHANYIGGSGSDTLQFSYTIADGISDDNGISLSLAIDLNGGSISDPIENEDARLTYVSPATWGILINASTASIVSITPPANGLYSAGTTLRFIANFSERVCGTNSPRIQLTINGNVRYATRVVEACATTMKFDYVVQVGEIDSDGIQLTNVSVDLTVGPAAIKDSFGDSATLSYVPATYASVLVGSVPPVELARTPPPDKTYAIGDNIDFVLNFSKSVTVTGGTPAVQLNVGGGLADAEYFSGSGSSSLTFRYTVVEGDLDNDGVVVTGFEYYSSSIKDADNNNITFSQAWPSLANVKVDGIRPTITTFVKPVDGIYRPGGNLDFVVSWSEPVTFTGSFPYINITMDSHLALKEAQSHSNDGSVTTYRYSIQNGDADFNGISVASTLTLPVGGGVKDAAGNSAYLTFSPINTLGVYVAPLGVDHWYDARNPASYGTSGATLTQFKDLIGTSHFYDISSVAIGDTPKRLNFSNIGQTMQVGIFNGFEKIYIVLETKGVTPWSVAFESFGSLINIELSGGKVSTTNICSGSCVKFFNGTNWQNTTAGTGVFGNYALNSKKIIMLDYQGLNNVELNFGSGYTGYIHEIYFLTGSAPTTFAAEFYRALQLKHPGATLATP